MAEINEFQKAWTRPISQAEWDAIFSKPKEQKKQPEKNQDSGS